LRDREKRHRKINERSETAKGEEGLEPRETMKIGAYAQICHLGNESFQKQSQ